MTRPCRACEGTPGAGIYAPEIGRRLFCVACRGTARIEDRIPARDAELDAETLRGNLSVRPWQHGGWYREVRAARVLTIASHTAIVECARAAFRAVPGLRG